MSPARPIRGSLIGGGFFGGAKSLTLVRSEISDNSVSFSPGQSTGGGFFAVNTDSTLQAPADAIVVKFVDSTVSGNTAPNLAGILVFGNVALELDNSTVNNNVSGTGSGGVGGVYLHNGLSNDGVTNCTPPTLTMTSSILANSGAAPRLDLRTNTAAPGLASFTVTANNSLIETICSSATSRCRAATTFRKGRTRSSARSRSTGDSRGRSRRCREAR